MHGAVVVVMDPPTVTVAVAVSVAVVMPPPTVLVT